MNAGRSDDEAILRELNDAYLHSDQNSDVARYDGFLAEDFTASLPDLVFRKPPGVPRPDRPAASVP